MLRNGLFFFVFFFFFKVQAFAQLSFSNELVEKDGKKIYYIIVKNTTDSTVQINGIGNDGYTATFLAKEGLSHGLHVPYQYDFLEDSSVTAGIDELSKNNPEDTLNANVTYNLSYSSYPKILREKLAGNWKYGFNKLAMNYMRLNYDIYRRSHYGIMLKPNYGIMTPTPLLSELPSGVFNGAVDDYVQLAPSDTLSIPFDLTVLLHVYDYLDLNIRVSMNLQNAHKSKPFWLIERIKLEVP